MADEQTTPRKRTFRKFTYRGIDLDQLLDLSSEQFMELVHCRARRRFQRGLKRKPMGLIKKLRAAKKSAAAGEKPECVKTHLRNMIIVPEMIGSVIGVYNGKVFNQIEIKPEMTGHYLAEFSISYKPVKHGRPGIGATHSSKFVPLNAEHVATMFKKGQDYRSQLELKKESLYTTIKALHGESNDELYALAGVQLQDFEAFQSFLVELLQVYDQTVNQPSSRYDFRSPALKLSFDFQKAVKSSHQRLKSATSNMSHHAHDLASTENNVPDESIKEVMNGMLREVSENADQLEKDMQQNMIVFSDDDARIETVLKQEQNEHRVTLLDHDNNEYVMMRPSDSTIIIDDPQLIHDFILIIVISFVLGWMFTWVGLPAFFGYILAGILIGPSGYNLIQELIQIETLAQLGVVLLIFVLGLEFSLDKLKKMWRLAVGGAMTILIVTVLVFILMGIILGVDLKEAVFVGACISLSSTAIVVKCVSPDQLDHLYGLLVMQDVILGFMLAIIPALSKSGVHILFAVIRISISFIVFGLICYGVLRLIPMVPRRIKHSAPVQTIGKNHELMLLGTVAICMSMLIISEHLGLGMEIGCFAAGVIIRSRKGMFETSLKLIEPVRDLFACLFFACMGLHIYPSFLASEAMLLFTLAAAVIGFKYIATCIILYMFKFDIQKSSNMAIALAQISEFAFILASRAKQLSIISREVYYLLLAITSITLISTPVLLKVTHRTGKAVPHNHHHSEEGLSTISVGMTEAEKLA
ncbi:hypothetical protein MFLAVUS_007257 [Mucor flavus]|uniref:Cation/H+ exchanger transmembrane domain-containing protein n=1 Tax=Mucor flavus TaxID=439312 RepID=A0ABP9Z3S6_9FUNG